MVIIQPHTQRADIARSYDGRTNILFHRTEQTRHGLIRDDDNDDDDDGLLNMKMCFANFHAVEVGSVSQCVLIYV